MKIRTFTALKHRNFRLFFLGQAISLVGTWMHSTAQGWLVLELTDSAFYLSLIHSLGYWPILFLATAGGVAADRMPKRTLLVATQAASLLIALALGALVSAGAVDVWHVAAAALMLGVVNTFDIPARQSFIVEMVGKDDLVNGIALNSALFHGARIVGPAVAGVLIASVGIAACFYINAATYLAILAALTMMRFERPRTPKPRRPFWGELADGLAYVRGSETVRTHVLMVGASSLFVVPYLALMPIFARDVLGVGAEGLGVMMGSAGVGALCAALMLATTGGGRSHGRTASAAAAVSASAALAFSFSSSALLSCALLALVGWGMITQMATVNALIQAEVPDELRGRVMSLYTTVFLGFIPIGNIIVGTLATYIGAPASLAAGACTALSAYALIHARKKAAAPA